MSDVREVFPGLVDDVTGAGVAAVARVQGDAPSGKTGSIGFAFRDSAGNLVLPQLDSSGKLPISADAPGTCVTQRAIQLSTAMTVGTAGTALTLTLDPSSMYARVNLTASCFRNGLVQVVQKDDTTETILLDAVIGSGAFTVNCFHECLEFATGATGAQELLVKYTPNDKASDFRTTVSLLKKA